jgi:hypothetical protein
MLFAEYSGLFGCDALLLGVQLLVF